MRRPGIKLKIEVLGDSIVDMDSQSLYYIARYSGTGEGQEYELYPAQCIVWPHSGLRVTMTPVKLGYPASLVLSARWRAGQLWRFVTGWARYIRWVLPR